MRSTKLRVLFAGLLAALFAWVVSGGVAQVQPVAPGQPPGKDKKGKESKDDKLPEDDNIPYTFPADRSAKAKLVAAREYLDRKDVEWKTVCSVLQFILENNSDSFFNSYYTVGGQKQINRISVKTEANRIIAAFPKEGREYYQQTYGQTASAMLDDAIKANYDLQMLSDLSQRYFHTKAGTEGTILLASIYLEQGNYLEAAYAFERVVTRPGAEELLTPRTLFKACLAFKRSGDPRHAELLKKNLEELQKLTVRDGLAIGRKTYTYEQLVAEINRPLELLRATTTVGEWAMRGGSPARSATIEGGPPFLDPTFRAPMLPYGSEDEEANNWIKKELDRLFIHDSKSKEFPLPGFFPITTADMVIFRGYNGVYGVATRDHVAGGRVVRAGELRWVSKTNMGMHQLVTKGDSPDIEMYRNVNDWWNTYNQTKVSSILFENPLLGSLSHDGQNVYFVDDVAIPPPPPFFDPNFGGINPMQQHRQSGPLADAIRAGRLAAVDLRTGALKWELGRVTVATHGEANLPPPPPLPHILNEEEADKSTNAFQLCLDAVFLGAPVPLNGKLYVLVEQAGVLRLLCLDPKNLIAVPGQTKKPTLVWSQKLGRPNNNLPADSVRRYQGATLAAGDGIILCPTNSGAIIAVNVMSRSLLWAHAYKKIPTSERNPRADIRFGPDGRQLQPQQLPYDRWRAGGPIIANGRVILTAYDSPRLECLDLRTGKLLWGVDRDPSDLYVGGVINDRVIVVGRTSVRAYHLTGEDTESQKPKVAFEPITLPNAAPTGHGVGGKGVFYLPVRNESAGRETVPPAELWVINVENGQITGKATARNRNDNTDLAKFGIGNLVFQDGMVFAQSAWELACYPQLEQKRSEMDRLLAANPKDPIGLLTRGELLLDEGELKKAIADFQEARKNNLPPEKQPLWREKMYFAYTELLRTDFAAGEAILDEYKALCEIPADPNEAPDEKVRRRDETDRRLREYLHLLARGREGQGRLGEAFDHYVSLANMGEGKNLLPMPDEPNVRMRPDVWARGRIEAMVRRADPAARKLLEERVNKEWDAVKNGTDLNRLREFVTVFGPYFKNGAEAQFLLSDKLLETNNDADIREAQTYLAQMRVAAEEPSVRARAIEALARLMVKNQMMEDAVGLYLQLGKEYPDVVVRDGKTGQEFMTRLLTDKRLLPYLEPSRYPMPTRMKAEERAGQNANINPGAQFEIEPTGDLFPMFKRYRFVMDQYRAGNNTWTLMGYDRATGVERVTFRGLAPPLVNTPQGMPAISKYVQANGQLLLVQLGTIVYCLDLTAGKERWQRNLLGDNAPQFINPSGRQSGEIGPDGEITVPFDDGFIVTLGKATILQANYAALLTRDGLEVVEPLTRRVLWTRRGIKERTQIYGDSQYIVLIEKESRGKPVSARVLRAVDGMPVEGSGDTGRELTMARSYQIQGRTALLSDGTGEQPRTLRLLDLGSGRDIWKRELGAKSIPIKSHNPEWTGYVKPSGAVEILSVRTGEKVATLQIDEKNLETDLKPAAQAQLLHDADRYYLFLDRDSATPSTNGLARQQVVNNYINTLRTTQVNGPLYAFDRATGKRLWTYGNGLFENQVLVLEHFAELPVIMAAGMVRNPNNQTSYPVVVLEKARGRLIYDRSVTYDGTPFQSLQIDQKNGKIELNKLNSRIIVTADDGGTTGQ